MERPVHLTSYNDHVKSIGVTEFKAHCLQLIDEVSRTGNGLILTKRGKPMARVLPPDPCEGTRFVPGQFSHMLVEMGDVVSPLDVEWEALK